MNNPARYILNLVNLTSYSDILTFSLGFIGNGPVADPNKNYIELYVIGDVSSKGLNSSGTVIVDSGVNVLLWVGGNLDLSGNGLVNNNGLASPLTIYGINPPSGTSQSFKLTGYADFFGKVCAPAADIVFGGNQTFIGAFVAKTANFQGNAQLYCDAASTVPSDYVSAFGACNLNNSYLRLGGSGFSSFYQVFGGALNAAMLIVDKGATLECTGSAAGGLPG